MGAFKSVKKKGEGIIHMNTLSNDFDKFTSTRMELVYSVLDNDYEFTNLCTKLQEISQTAYDLAQHSCFIAEKTAYTQGF